MMVGDDDGKLSHQKNKLQFIQLLNVIVGESIKFLMNAIKFQFA